MAKLTQLQCQGEAVPPGEIQIQQRDVGPAIHRFRQCSQPMHGMHHAVTSVGQQAADRLGHGGIVFYQQDAQRLTCKQLDVTGGDVRAGAVDRQGQIHGEPGADAKPAAHADLAFHRHGEFLTDRQPEPAAAVVRTGARTLALFEALEQSLLLFRPDARPPSRTVKRRASPCWLTVSDTSPRSANLIALPSRLIRI
nr:hypothetical protein Xcnt_03945 [Xanthomonas campestris pv. centellae]